MIDALYTPKLTNNLFSVHAATLKGEIVSFGSKLIGNGVPMCKLCKLNCDIVSSLSVNRASAAAEKESSNKTNLWNQRLAIFIENNYIT